MKVAADVKGWMQQVATEAQTHGFISQETVNFKWRPATYNIGTIC